MDELRRVLTELKVGDNNTRPAAEQRFHEIRVGSPVDCVGGLLELAREGKEFSFQAMVLLRRCVDGGRLDVFRSLPTDVQNHVKSALLQLLASPPPGTSKVLNACISDLGVVLGESWGELVPALLQGLQSGAETLQVNCLEILTNSVGAYVSRHPDLALPPYAGHLVDAFGALLQSTSTTVRVHAAEAVLDVSSLVLDSKVTKKLKSFMPAIFNILSHTLSSGSTDSALQILSGMSSVGEIHPTFFAPDMLKGLFQICYASVDELIQQQALEVITSVAEQPGVKKYKGFGESFVKLVVDWLVQSDFEVDDQWHMTPHDDLDPIDITPADIAADSLARVVPESEAVAKAMEKSLRDLLRSPDQSHQYAALRMVVDSVEGVTFVDAFTKEFAPMVHRYFDAPHPMVRLAAMECVGAFASACDEYIESCHGDVVSRLSSSLSDPSPRIRHFAALTMAELYSEADDVICVETLRPLLTACFDLLGKHNEPLFVKREVLSLVAALGKNAGEGFREYHPHVVMLLKEVLGVQTHDLEMRKVIGRAIECVAVLEGDALREMVPMLLAVQQSVTGVDDPRWEALLDAWPGVAEELKQEFVPLMDCLMPPLLSLPVPPTRALCPNEHPEDDEQETTLPDGTRLAVKTTTISDTVRGVSLYTRFLNALGDAFPAKWLEGIISVVIPIVRSPYRHDLRRAAAGCCPFILKAVRVAAPDMLPQVVPAVLESLSATLEGMDDPREIDDVVNYFGQCFIDAPDRIEDGEATARVLRSIVEKSMEREKKNDDEPDEEDDDVDDAEDDSDSDSDGIPPEHKLQQRTSMATQAFLKHQPRAAGGFSGVWIPFITGLFDGTDHAKYLALSSLADIVEFCAGGTPDLFLGACSAFLSHLSSDDEDVARSAAYGVGQCAKLASKGSPTPPGFAADAPAGLLGLLAKAKEKEFGDDVIAVAAAAALQFLDGAQAPSIISAVLQCLPVDGDEAAVKEVYRAVFSLAAAQNPFVLPHAPQLMNLGKRLLDQTPSPLDDETRSILHGLAQGQQ